MVTYYFTNKFKIYIFIEINYELISIIKKISYCNIAQSNNKSLIWHKTALKMRITKIPRNEF